jgi:peroxiredoxin
MLKIGDKAPAFTLFSNEKKEVSLSDFQGQPVVILFFPAAFTGVCTTELCNTRDDIQTYKHLNTQIIAISVDSIFTLDKFSGEQNLNFPLLSDFNRTVSADYGCRYEDFVFGMKHVSKRSAFVVDKNGIIQYAEVLESAGDLPNFEAIKSTLQQL